MKLLKSLVAAAVAILMFTSCGALKSFTNNTDYQNGSTTGTVLAALAAQYLSQGKIDMTNVQNILNVATLASSLSSLKSGSTQASTDFGTGLMASNTKVTNNNLGNVLTGLTALSNLNLGGITNSLQNTATATKTETQQSASKVSSALEGILSLLK